MKTLHFITAPLHATPRRSLLGVLLLGVLLLSACSGGLSDSWAGVTQTPDQTGIYLSYDKKVVALDPLSGEVRWSYSASGARFFAVPTVVDDVVYVGDYEGRMHAIDQATGEALWVYEPDRKQLVGPLKLEAQDRVIGGATVDSNLVYFGLGSRNLVAIARGDGTEAWTFETDHGVWATPLYVPANPDNAGSVAMLYFPSLDHHLYAVNAATGQQVWRKDLGAAAPGNLVYDAARQRVYVGTFGSEVLAVDLATGDIAARYPTDEWVWGSPAFVDDVLYFGDLSGQMYAVKVTDAGFEQVWQKKVAEGGIRATPLVVDDTVVVASKDKHIYAVSTADGASRWYKKTKSEALSNLVYVPADPNNPDSADLVVAGTEAKDQRLIAFKLTTGDEVWHYSQ